MSRMPGVVVTCTLTACPAPALENWSAAEVGSGDESGSSSGEGTSSSSGGWSTSSTGTSSGGEAGSESGSSSGGSTSGAGSSTADTSSGAGTSASASTGGPTGVCGDGVVDADEECDDAIDDACVSCFRDRWVFATGMMFSPKWIGGLGGADNLCAQLAQKAGLGKNWKSYKAWLSDSTESAGERLFPTMGRYRRVDGTVVVDNFEQLLSGMLHAPINVDEYGNPAPGGAWTGTLPDGSAAPGTTHCEDWTIDTYTKIEGHHGSCSMVDGGWTFHPNPGVNPTGCDDNLRLYCFEGA